MTAAKSVVSVAEAADLLGETGSNRVQKTRRRLQRAGVKLMQWGHGRTLRYMVLRADLDRLAPPAEPVSLDARTLVEGMRREMAREFKEQLDSQIEELEARMRGEIESLMRVIAGMTARTVSR